MNAYCASTTKYPGRCEPSPAVHGGRVLLPGYLLNTPLLKTVLHPSVCVQQMNSGATLKRQNTEWRGRIPCAWAEGVRLGKTKTSGSGDNKTWSLSYEA